MRQFYHVPFLFFVIVDSDFGKHTDMDTLLTEFWITASRQLFNIIFSRCVSLQKKSLLQRFSNSFLLKITSYGSLLNIYFRQSSVILLSGMGLISFLWARTFISLILSPIPPRLVGAETPAGLNHNNISACKSHHHFVRTFLMPQNLAN